MPVAYLGPHTVLGTGDAVVMGTDKLPSSKTDHWVEEGDISIGNYSLCCDGGAHGPTDGKVKSTVRSEGIGVASERTRSKLGSVRVPLS